MKIKKLLEVTELIKRGVTPKYVENDGITVINQKCIRDNRIDFKLARQTSKDKKITEEKVLMEGDILVNSTGTGTLGRTAQIKEVNETMTVDTHVTIVRPKKDINHKFLGYFIRLNEPLITSMGKGATNQIELSASDLGNIDITLPSRKQQDKIVDILSAYDALIENNLKRIELLEEAAESIYKEWFVNFRFPGYEKWEFVDGVPNIVRQKPIKELTSHTIGGGWGKENHEGNYIEEAYVIRGTDIENILNGDISNVPYRYHTQSNIENRLLQQGDLVLEVSNGQINNIGRCLLYTKEIGRLFDNNIICASFCKMLRVNEFCSPNILYLHLKHIHSSGKIKYYINASAAGINNFRFNDLLDEEKINILPKSLINEFENRVNPLLDMREKLNLQNSRLKEARDILISKLIMGEIEV